jgi:hypothetical protein
MIDVQVRPSTEPHVNEVDELLEGMLLPHPVQALERREHRVAGVDGDGAEQVLEARRQLEVRVALHVEEDVAGRRLRQQSKARSLVDRQQVVLM